MSIIVKLDEQEFVEMDMRSITPEEAAASDATAVSAVEETEEPEAETTGRTGKWRRRGSRVLAVGAIAGVAVLVRRLRRRTGGDVTDEIEIDADETELEN